MASTKALLVYSSGNKIDRHYVIPDDDAQMTPAWIAQFVGQGETSIIVDKAELKGVHPRDVLIAHGLQPAHSGRLVVVNPIAVSSNVAIIGVIRGDEALDSISGAILIPHDQADPSWQWSVGLGFVAPPGIPKPPLVTV